MQVFTDNEIDYSPEMCTNPDGQLHKIIVRNQSTACLCGYRIDSRDDEIRNWSIYGKLYFANQSCHALSRLRRVERVVISLNRGQILEIEEHFRVNLGQT
jgi:hypothetical protein